MRNLITASFVAASIVFAGNFAGNAFAQTSPSVPPAAAPAASDVPAQLLEKVRAICADKSVHLTDKAMAACNDVSKLPKVTKAGLFRNAGIGAEFNTLIRQH